MRGLGIGLVLVLVLVLAPHRAHAEPKDAVALLPLDADARLEIYGQPVASEIARALVAGGIDVVVVGPKMAVPERARLILDGTITAGKGEAVSLAVRIRDRKTGSVLDKLDATAPALTSIDRAAADLSARVLPAVQARLAAKATPEAAPPPHTDDGGKVVLPPLPPEPRMIAAIAPAPASEPASPLLALHDGFAPALAAWADHHHRRIETNVAIADLSNQAAAKTATTRGADLAIAVEPLAYDVTPGPVPLARARVRVRIADRTHVLWERVVVTDTVVGDRNLGGEQLAVRVAREVLRILEPHLKRAVATWR
ncbi:MAG: hypothetical protein ACM31C_18875 [Acidobacteriota bacterium]